MAMATGAASGALAATGVGLIGQVAGGAAIAMTGNATSQVIKNNGFDNFNVGDMLLDGAIGGIAGLAGGSGVGSRHLTNLGKQTVKRTTNALTHKGLSAAAKEATRATSYYLKNAKHVAVPLTKALFNSGATSLTGALSESLYNRLLR